MDRTVLLETFEQLGGTTEYEMEDIRSFLQVKQYQELQDPTKFLIVGGRGAGKTRVFKTFVGEDGFRRVIGAGIYFNRPNYKNTDVLVGYSKEDNSLPNQNVLGTLQEDKDTMAFWVGAIVLKLLAFFANDTEVCTVAEEFFSQQELELFEKKTTLKSPGKWLSLYQEHPENWENFLDEVDEILARRDRWLIMADDQIDRISPDHDIMYSYIRTLIMYWFSVSTRWRRLKCKVFIRTDLIDLSWNTLSLYRLLIRRLANAKTEEQTREMIEYMSAVPGLVQENPSVGYLPTEEEEIIRRFIIYLIGRYMGASPKKGDSYSWVPNHLQDANGDLAPRSFLKCYACAAKVMLQNPKTQSTTALLTASSIQGAVQEVSADRVAELKEDFPWLENLKTVLEGETLLMPGMEFRKKMKQLLDMDTKVKPPVRTVEELMNLLMSLGIIQKNTDERINMPEIYLHGFGLRRKGGLRRPK